MLDEKGKEVIPLKYDQLLEGFSEALVRARFNKKWGFINIKNETIIPFNYSYVNNLSEGLAGVEDAYGKYGFIDKTGANKVPHNYDDVGEFSESLAAVKFNGKVGFVGKDGKVAIRFKYDNVHNFDGGLAGVNLFDKLAVINASGKELTAFKYNDVYTNYSTKGLNILKVSKQDNENKTKYGVVDINGKEVIPVMYEELEIHTSEFIVVKLNGKSGAVNPKHKTVLPCDYEGIYYDPDNAPPGSIYKWGEENNTRVFYLKSGKPEILKYEYVRNMREGRRAAKFKSRWGYIDGSGAEVIAFTYDTLTDFVGEYASVMRDKKIGYIDRSGKEIIPIKYDYIGPFKNGLAKVEINKKTGFINNLGKEIVSTKYDGADNFDQGFAMVKFNKKWGFINEEGKEVLPPTYDNIDYFSDGMLAVSLNNKLGFVDSKGKEVIPMKYDKMVKRFYNGRAEVALNGKTIKIHKSGKEF